MEQNLTNIMRSLLPGILAALLLYLGSVFLAGQINRVIAFSIVSPLLIAIIIGAFLNNSFTLNPGYRAGLNFNMKRLLRLGIVLMGLRQSFVSFMRIGASSVIIVAVCIFSAVIVTSICIKAFKIHEKLGTLIIGGTSICGISAVMAIAPVIDAKEEEVSYAIGIITFFGLLATLIYPFAVELLFKFNAAQAGFFIGTSVHDTSQVIASGMIYQDLWNNTAQSGVTGIDYAITTKLIRNTFMIFVIPILGIYHNTKYKGTVTKSSKSGNVLQYIPLFVFGYVLFGILRSLGDLLFTPSNPIWINFLSLSNETAVILIGTAVASIGLNTSLRKIHLLGIKPFICGLVSMLTVGVISYLMIIILGTVFFP